MWWLVIAIPGVVLGVLGVLGWLGAGGRRETGAALAGLRAMPDTEAEQRALDLLGRPPFHVRRATKPLTNPDMPSQVVALLNRYEEVSCGEFWIGIAALTQPTRLPGFIKIGEDSEFTEILVRPGDPKIYISSGEGPQSAMTLETERTIWHVIIIASGSDPSGLTSE